MDLTDEERAVLAKVCQRNGGHQFDLSELIVPEADGRTMAIGTRDRDSAPHVSCQRCGRVWLVVAEGESYEAAEQALNGQLAPEHRRVLRADRKAARLAREAQARTAVAEVAAPVDAAASIAPPMMPAPVPSHPSSLRP